MRKQGPLTRMKAWWARRKRDRDVDVYLFSYPKCGRTWLTLQMGRALAQHFGVNVPNLLKLAAIANASPGAPHIRVTHENTPQRKKPHELETSKQKFRGKKVIFLVRDPRDVIVSLYFQKTKRQPIRKFWFFQRRRRETHSPFSGTISDFLRHDIGGFDTILRYYNIWAENRHLTSGFLLVRYEDMHADPHRELRRVLDFVGLDGVSDEVIDDAVQYASFDNMHRMEASGQGASCKLKPADNADRESFKTRRGKAKGYVDYLSPDEIESLNNKMRETLSDFYGYEPCAGRPAGE